MIPTKNFPCPSCGVTILGITSATDDDSDVGPGPGSISLCMNCGEFHSFDEDLKPHFSSQEDIESVKNDMPELWVKALAIRLRYFFQNNKLGWTGIFKKIPKFRLVD